MTAVKRKISSEKNRLKRASRNPDRVRAGLKAYKTSERRFHNVVGKIEKLGYDILSFTTLAKSIFKKSVGNF